MDVRELLAEETRTETIWDRACHGQRQASAFLYVIGPGRGPYKIGYAKRPPARLRVLQIGCPSRLYLWAQKHCPDGPDCEAIAHRHLAGVRRRGEWFSCTLAEAVRAIEVASAAIEFE